MVRIDPEQISDAFDHRAAFESRFEVEEIKAYRVTEKIHGGSVRTVRIVDHGNGEVSAECSCPAGQHNTLCKHVRTVIAHVLSSPTGLVIER